MGNMRWTNEWINSDGKYHEYLFLMEKNNVPAKSSQTSNIIVSDINPLDYSLPFVKKEKTKSAIYAH